MKLTAKGVWLRMHRHCGFGLKFSKRCEHDMLDYIGDCTFASCPLLKARQEKK